MVTLRMIDTMGFGIREIMWKGQASRYLPLPDFDLSEPGHVTLRIQGRFIDENYSRTLLTHIDLSWPEVLALDSIGKGKRPDDDVLPELRSRGLVEGRKPKLAVLRSNRFLVFLCLFSPSATSTNLLSPAWTPVSPARSDDATVNIGASHSTAYFRLRE